MKKLISIICVFALIAAFGGCATDDANQNENTDVTKQSSATSAADGQSSDATRFNSNASEKIKIVCTVFPIYDWTRQIIGEDNMDKFDLTLLINSGIDLHSFNPSVQEIVSVKESDLFIYNGGESDEWVEDVFENANSDTKQVNLMEFLGDDKILEEVEFDGDDEHEDDEDDHDGDDDDHDGDDDDHDHEEGESDEHIWLSVKNASALCDEIADILSEADPDGADSYKANLVGYKAVLADLDKQYQAAADSANVTTILVADRFPFMYLANDYGLDYEAAFSGCSAETEASFSVITSLADKLNELKLKTVIVTEGSDKKIAETVIEATNDKDQKILVLNAMQSKMSDSETYVSIMESNLEALKEALSNE